MKKQFIAFTLTLVCTICLATAQTITIKGQVVDQKNTKESIIGAFVKLNPSDTLGLKKQGRVVATDMKGNFTIYSTAKTNVIEISFIGYKSVTLPIAAGKTVVNLGQIKLTESGRTIATAVVTGKAKIGKMDGDTTQYNAAAFKTNPDATTEDLLKKMPGVTVGTDGAVESAGEKVAKVLVNGKAYFEDDPSLALKSLPSDAVESIQIFDDKTDDAKFSGFDDGQRVRTINIVTKKGVINSTFGKVYAGYGTGGRYAAGAGVNIMTDNHRWVVTAQSNNVNNQGFTLNDIGNMGGGGWGMRGGRGSGGADMGAYITSAYGGIMQTNAAGVNYSGEFGKKLKLSGTYFFQGIGSDQYSTRAQNYLTMPRYYTQGSSSTAYQYSHRFNLKAEWTPNENNKVTFSPRVNYSTNHGGSYNRALTYTGIDGDKTNGAINNYDTKLDNYNLSADLWWMHSFGKSGRTLSLGGNIYGQKGWGNRNQLSYYESLNNDNILIPDSLRQIGYLDVSRYTLTGSATYTEPLSKRSRLNLNYTINYDRSISDRQGLNYDKDLQDYTLLDTTTTNYMSRNYTTQTGSVGYGYNIGSTFNLTAAVRFQHATMNNKEVFPNPDLSNYQFNAWLPSLNVRYNPNKSNSLNLDYSTYSIFPSITQLQNILDVTNILQVTTGDPNLKQSYSHNVGLFYRYNNTDKNVNFMIAGRGNVTSNYIANHRRFLTQDTVVSGTTIPSGAQFTSPVNLNGYMNASIYSNVTFGIRPLKSNMSIMVMYRYTKSPSVENYVEYMSQSNNIGGRIQITSNISEKVDFTLSYSPSVNYSNSGTGRFDRYFGHDASAFLNLYLWKGFYIQGDATWRNNYGTQANYSQHYALINAAIAQKFYKNQLEIKLSAYDLLAQNRSFRQSVTDTYTLTTTSNILKRYFMASLTWKFDTRKNKESLNDSSKPSRQSRGFGGGRPSMH